MPILVILGNILTGTKIVIELSKLLYPVAKKIFLDKKSGVVEPAKEFSKDVKEKVLTVGEPTGLKGV